MNRLWQWIVQILVFGQGWDSLAGQWLSAIFLLLSLPFTKDELDSSVWYHQKPYTLVLQTDLGRALHLTLMSLNPDRCLDSYSAAWSEWMGNPSQSEQLKIPCFLLALPQEWIWIHLIHASGSWTRTSWV